MSALPTGPIDRPFLRVWEPELNDQQLTVAQAHEQLRAPTLAKLSKGYRQTAVVALAKWAEFEATLDLAAQRIIYPLPISTITSSVVRRFQEWLVQSTDWSPSYINRIRGEIMATLAAAGDEGLEVNPVRCKRLPEPVGSKIWFDELQIACLWSSAAGMEWPPKISKPRRNAPFAGTGLEPSTFWRAILILLRAYGIRVQDLVAYEKDKQPVLWRDITFAERTPNPHGRANWSLGWLYYQSGKVGRKYYLPLTKYTRAAIDRLHAGALERARAAGLDAVPSDWPVLPCPKSGLPRNFRVLCNTAKVVKPIQLHGVEPIGDQWKASTSLGVKFFSTEAKATKWLADEADYVLEDFRSTAATFYAEIEESLPNKVCGWSEGARANVGRKNYINDEPVLLKYLPTAPMPRCFDDWL